MTIGREALLRLTRSFLAHHLGWLRGTDAVDDQGWQDALLLSDPPVLADSLELVTLAGMFADAYGLREVGIEDLLLAKPSVERYTSLLEQAWKEPREKLVFFSSGSTGHPKSVVHTWNNLLEEVEVLCPRFEQLLGEPPRRIVAMVPPHHMYGFLWTVLYPEYRNLPVIQQTPVFTQFQDGDMVVAVPLFVKMWKDRAIQLPKAIRVLLSTAPLPRQDAQWLSSQAAWLEIYGSTETAGIGTRNQQDAPFELLPYWQTLTAAFGGEPVELQRENTVFPLPDNVQLEGRFVVPQGRKDGAVQVGGVNVFPGKVREYLTSLPGVADAAVRLYDSPQGPRLKALIVPQPQQDTVNLERLLRECCAAKLSSAERPIRYTFNSAIPTNTIGKKLDWE